MKLVIFGASGSSGQAILKLALSKSFRVTVLMRNASAITIQSYDVAKGHHRRQKPNGINYYEQRVRLDDCSMSKHCRQNA